MQACIAGLRRLGGGPDPPSTPAHDQLSQQSDAPATPTKRVLFLPAPRSGTPGAKAQRTLPWPVTPRSKDVASTPLAKPPEVTPPAQVQLTQALQRLLLSTRTDPAKASLVQAVADETLGVCQCHRQRRMPGELVDEPKGDRGLPGIHKRGRPPDLQGPRVGRGGYLTPDATKNNRPDGQAVLRRDCTLPARLAMAQAVSELGVSKVGDLKSILPVTWRQLETRFARIRWEELHCYLTS